MDSENYTVDANGRIVVPINDFSDGDPNACPHDSFHTEADPVIYLEKLGAQWMQQRNEFQQERIRRKKFLAEDAEGTQDIFKEMVCNLQAAGTLDEAISEPSSMDWKAERNLMANHLTRVRMQHSFIPRLGELVLCCPGVHGEVKFEWETETFQMYSHKRKKFLGIPKWYAGVVSQVAEEPLVLHDAIIHTDKSCALNMSGFRIEMFPDPNSSDKSLSNQYKYVPLSLIRPFSYWSVYLQGVDTKDFHPSIANALTIMSSYSMLEKYRFKGEWPNASISCKCIYLGAELLIRGDGVRLMPRDLEGNIMPTEKVTEIMVIEKIELRLMNCDAKLESPLLCESIAPRLIGKIYTINAELAHNPEEPMTDFEISQCFECTGMRAYGPWYRVHEPPNDTVEISINHVVGRCFESEYMDVMFQDLSLDIDLEGVRGGRLYGQKTDDRIAPGKDWFFGDYRLETLSLDSLNGVESGRNDESRDPKMYRGILKIIDGTAVPADVKDAKLVRAVGRPYEGLIGSRSGNTKFDGVGKMSSMVSTALGGDALPSHSIITPMQTSAPDTGADESGEDESVGGSRKNGMLSDSEEDPIMKAKTKRPRLQ
ncbi:uncharacterized protein GIQ15_06030 [Arthroderma uncinatum]|uniref:uncharacterized protein n=1 Tax=Arthroderma uncinatum TaxID=74035 RepID=UPI00144A79B8|nr:uncharacterized protein GIQ15_06030 [Arthroderma uncinatum]KAF3480683.1 hypothetical protein GIQ15_06030 [Arthroderma uncinatum]